jgi:undecaprenyl-diphosphatase
MSIEKAKLLTNNFKCGKILQKTTNKGYTKGYTTKMKSKNTQKIYLAIAVALLGVFLLFTAIALTVDVKPIGPNGSSVGLSTVNDAFRKALGTTEGYNELWYGISELAGLIPLAVAACFAILGFCQAIKRKSLLKVDSHLFALAGFYALLLLAYVGFEIVEINFRPVLMEGELEASYPSSHTMLSIGIMSTAIFELHELIKNKKAILIITDILCCAVALTVLLGRLLSGVHWLTDIIAGALLAASLVCFYRYGALLLENIKSKKQKESTVND